MSVHHCNVCMYFRDIGGPIGVCRRYPEFMNKSMNDWCGEFSAIVVNTQHIEEKKKPGRPKKETGDA